MITELRKTKKTSATALHEFGRMFEPTALDRFTALFTELGFDTEVEPVKIKGKLRAKTLNVYRKGTDQLTNLLHFDPSGGLK